MTPKVRPHPTIPDHEVLRKIGGGAYGEVWLARGVTGALRAVKVVRRDDFEDERTFEREFDGILKFEPISRDHPGLVNILHVGRSTADGGFYYYVMELGDDIGSGREINPVEYEPRTLRGDHHQGIHLPWPVDECIDVGIRLAEALEHLHRNGLAHRDVKPSNVIFVNGRAKLADIGLVAARGQMTFVGTEGFVPPEGPGSSMADIYSLGKVLYEMATGMDRMNFPELPDEIPEVGDRKRWLELNRIICEVCEPRVSKRTITSGAALADALKCLQRGKRRRSGMSLALSSLLLLGAAGWISWQMVKDSEWVASLLPAPPAPVKVMGMLRVLSTPEGADVIDRDGEVIGTTPTSTIPVEVGQEVFYTLRKQGFRPHKVQGMVNLAAAQEPMILHGLMQVFSPPRSGESWSDHLGLRYLPFEDSHLSADYVTGLLWREGVKQGRIQVRNQEFIPMDDNGAKVEVVLTTAESAAQFCRWFHRQAVTAGFLTEDHEVLPGMETGFLNAAMSEKAVKESLAPFRLLVRRIRYGKLYVTSQPSGAELFINGKSVGLTHGELVVPDVKPGEVELLLVLEGYKPLSKRCRLADGETLEVHLELQKNQSVVPGRPWENSLGMKFVPLGMSLMVAAHETRVQDFQAYCKEGRIAPPKLPYFHQEPNHPVVNVSREDAEKFCQWLTLRERKLERISASHRYRLPTDAEWSQLVGLNDEEAKASPSAKDAQKRAIFPWGESWVESNRPGNFADMSAALSPSVDVDHTIAGYEDGHAYTAPVGSYEPNPLGIHDLSGNVQEWVSDPYSNQPGNTLGVLRGGGWNSYRVEDLYSGARNGQLPSSADVMYGFRIVLGKDAAPSGE